MSDGGADTGRREPASLGSGGTTAELIHRLNTSWRVAGPAPAGASLKQRLGHGLRRAFGTFLGHQETFNSIVVQYINATTGQGVLDEALDELRRYGQASAARERRLEAAVAAIRAGQEELRTSVGVLHQASHTLARQISASGTAGQADQPAQTPSPAAARAVPAREGHALSHKYVGFEDLFRGSPETIRAGLAEYVPLFEGASDVLDIGCGRGEFLALLRERGVNGRGIDLNESMVEVCRQAGLEAEAADALSYLERQPDGSLGGLLAAQVVEHLEPAYLTQMLDFAFQKLRPGAVIVLETINPACWFAFFESYVRDITHVRPLHPDTLKFLLVAAGFQHVDIRYRAPYPQHEKLQTIPTGTLGDTAETLNANVEKINRLLFTNLDYAAIGRRPFS